MLILIHFKKLTKKDLNLVESDFGKKIFSSDFTAINYLVYYFIFQKECFEEIFAFSQYLNLDVKINVKGDFMDTCGTGGDKKGSFNLSTATSILLSIDIKNFQAW